MAYYISTIIYNFNNKDEDENSLFAKVNKYKNNYTVKRSDSNNEFSSSYVYNGLGCVDGEEEHDFIKDFSDYATLKENNNNKRTFINKIRLLNTYITDDDRNKILDNKSY